MPTPLPAARALRAGPLTCWLVGADLRRVRVGGVEVVQRIYAAVRDQDWSTVPLHIIRQEVAQTADGFLVASELASTRGDIAYRARLVLTGSADGTLRVAFDGTADGAFRRQRIGLCVLLPATLAGGAVRVEHDDGAHADLAIPSAISPWQPARGIRALETTLDGAGIRLAFSGDVFEMEDQRNWGDASFKIYGTPLDLPRPAPVAPGDSVAQAVTLGVLRVPEAPAAPPVALLHVGDVVGPRARIGHAQVADHGHVHLVLDTAGDWRQQLAAAEFTRSRDGLPVVVAVPAEAVTAELALALATLLPPDSELLALDGGERSDPTAAHALLRAALPADVPVGVGSRGQFTEVNRGAPGGGGLLAFPINPVVHADDDWSLLENTPALGDIVASAKSLAVTEGGVRPLRIGPLALPAGDPRIATQVGAAWLVAALAHLLPRLDADDALTLGPAHSFSGTPSAAVLRALADSNGVLPVTGHAPDLAAFAVRTAKGSRVFVANTGHLPASLLLTGLRHGGEALHLAPRTMAIVEG